MIRKDRYCYLLIVCSSYFILCNSPKKGMTSNDETIIGSYVNKIKVPHFKENLELFSDSSFRLFTQYEWDKYEYTGTWQQNVDTLLLKCGKLNTADYKYFKPLWLIGKKQKELKSLNNLTYSLEKITKATF